MKVGLSGLLLFQSNIVTEDVSGCLLKKNIEILLEWTIPEDYMNKFREANKSVEEILEELAN